MPIGRLGFDWDQIKIKSYPLTPALSPKGARGKGSRSGAFQNRSSTQKFQVDVPSTSTSVSPLSLRAVRRFGRVRVCFSGGR